MRTTLRLFAPALLGLAVLAAGCGGGAGQVEKGPGQYEGPAIRIDSTGQQHLLILTAPTAGWSFTFDQVKKAFGHQELFVTVTRPNPAAMHAQVIVEQRLGTSVDVATPLTVYVREVTYGADPSERPYQFGGKSG